MDNGAIRTTTLRINHDFMEVMCVRAVIHRAEETVRSVRPGQVGIDFEGTAFDISLSVTL